MKEKVLALLEASREFSGALGQACQPTYGEFLEKYRSKTDQRDIFLAQASAAYSPEPIEHALIVKRGPYANPKPIKESYAGAVERGWLEETSSGQFIATEQSVSFFKEIVEIDDKLFFELKGKAASDLTPLLSLFNEIVENIKKTDAVDDMHAFDQSMQFRKVTTYVNDLQDLRDKVFELLSYRDDSHIAAWRPHILEGYVWEAFSRVWEGEVQTAAELVEKLPNRNYSEEDYQNAFDELKTRGWLSEEDGKVSLTDEGKTVREEVEELTNEYFLAGFTGVSEKVIDEAVESLKQLAEQFQPEPETAS